MDRLLSTSHATHVLDGLSKCLHWGAILLQKGDTPSEYCRTMFCIRGHINTCHQKMMKSATKEQAEYYATSTYQAASSSRKRLACLYRELHTGESPGGWCGRSGRNEVGRKIRFLCRFFVRITFFSHRSIDEQKSFVSVVSCSISLFILLDLDTGSNI